MSDSTSCMGGMHLDSEEERGGDPRPPAETGAFLRSHSGDGGRGAQRAGEHLWDPPSVLFYTVRNQSGTPVPRMETTCPKPLVRTPFLSTSPTPSAASRARKWPARLVMR